MRSSSFLFLHQRPQTLQRFVPLTGEAFRPHGFPPVRLGACGLSHCAEYGNMPPPSTTAPTANARTGFGVKVNQKNCSGNTPALCGMLGAIG
jgi:hypothetical protein